MVVGDVPAVMFGCMGLQTHPSPLQLGTYRFYLTEQQLLSYQSSRPMCFQVPSYTLTCGVYTGVFRVCQMLPLTGLWTTQLSSSTVSQGSILKTLSPTGTEWRPNWRRWRVSAQISWQATWISLCGERKWLGCPRELHGMWSLLTLLNSTQCSHAQTICNVFTMVHILTQTPTKLITT